MGPVTWQPSPRGWWGTIFPGVGQDKGGGIWIKGALFRPEQPPPLPLARTTWCQNNSGCCFRSFVHSVRDLNRLTCFHNFWKKHHKAIFWLSKKIQFFYD